MSEIRSTTEQATILVTGATGYVGGRLIPRLVASNYKVRVFTRDASRLQGRAWLENIEIVEGDVLEPESLRPALDGVKAAYYLVQSVIDSNPESHKQGMTGAMNFGQQAREAGVERIIHLGTLGSPDGEAESCLNARQCAGNALRESGVRVTEFRASVIVGSGSLTFEMIRYLTERVPIMVCPRWVTTRVQPIAIKNVLEYLIAALEEPESAEQILEIGGPEVMTYKEMLLQYADVRRLRRLLILVPVVTPRLSSYWVHFITPVPASIARPHIDSLRFDAVVRDNKARFMFPEIKRINYRTAVRLAIDRLDAREVETTWNDALVTSQGAAKPVILTSHEGMLLEQRQRIAGAEPADVFEVFTRLGGDHGWPYMNWAWRLRGYFDRLIGGVGMRRGRRDPDEIRVGDALDFWRVEAVEPDSLLRLRAEMKLPGSAWLQFETAAVQEQSNSSSEMPVNGTGAWLTQTAFFASKGLPGLLYWYLLYPIHGVIFSGMIRKLVAEAEERAEERGKQRQTDKF